MSKTIVLIAHHAGSLLNFRGDWIRSLCTSGGRVICLAPDYSDQEKTAVRALGAEAIDYGLRRTGMNPLRDLWDTWTLSLLLRKLRPDVAFAFSTKPVIYGTLAAWLANVKRRVAMIEGVGFVFTDSAQPLGWRRRMLRFLVSLLYKSALQRADQVIFLNQDDRNEFVSRGLALKERTMVLGGIGVDLEAWRVAPSIRKPVTFLLAARLLREKGVLEYVEAAKQVLAVHPDVRFLLLGGLDSNPGALSQSDVQAWVNEGVLEWPGHVDIKPWMTQASVFVLPSWREGVPRSTQEAMAMGRPIITTDAPGCRETVIEGVNGYRVPVRDIQALKHAMLLFIENPGMIEPMGEASRRLAEERFDVNMVNARLSACVWNVDAAHER
ncbi:glycosyltransferase family 1 protein [Alcaligenes faecalis]|uniref:glycosyltransferase family 4 protein n=1 Tax=Alcaligenes faecalis TaxID=511 RepID=UPI000A2E8B1C|nr:glycosyltransferase family 4 protein [Alcaligenes faecalis]OSZ44472.1 glycosyltransferase family 1 protein [Alcaligenes faecalis]OSZ47725.1 glycosyltransferase family 1 protein [Alcaligenes faecalis]OSZ50317.1 glycosyltransferase family 1 protein [Alcaligenes faecalis]